MTRVLTRDRREEILRCREGHVTGVVLPQVSGCLEPPEAGGGQGGPFPEPLEGAGPRSHLDFALLAARSMREYISVILIEPQNLPQNLW